MRFTANGRAERHLRKPSDHPGKIVTPLSSCTDVSVTVPHVSVDKVSIIFVAERNSFCDFKVGTDLEYYQYRL